MKATAIAAPNIAFIKYWGKADGRDPRLNIPPHDNLSMTFGGINGEQGPHTVTTVELSSDGVYSVVINGEPKPQGSKEHTRIANYLDFLKERGTLPKNVGIQVHSNNNGFPTGAGVASSASAGAALAYALVKAAEIPIPPSDSAKSRNISKLARLFSGSASRSVPDGDIIVWRRGGYIDGRDSYAAPFVPEGYWPNLRVLITIVSDAAKKVTSEEGHGSARTSPVFDVWANEAPMHFRQITRAIKARDISAVGEIAEQNAILMHMVMQTQKPPLLYWSPETIGVMHAVRQMRETGTPAYFTIDAGPQVKVITDAVNMQAVQKYLNELPYVKQVIPTKPGHGARLVDQHLF